LGKKDSILSDINGIASFNSGTLFNAKASFLVLNVSKPNWTYEPREIKNSNEIQIGKLDIQDEDNNDLGFPIFNDLGFPIFNDLGFPIFSKLVPTSTKLYQNYPNPPNPETWIPYQLAEDCDVIISIYDSTGLIVRILYMGSKSAGFYTTKDKATYWDGRNKSGETVASGIYFYSIHAGTLTATKKMIIQK
jgi:hypothetical protein